MLLSRSCPGSSVFFLGMALGFWISGAVGAVHGLSYLRQSSWLTLGIPRVARSQRLSQKSYEGLQLAFPVQD